MGRSPCCDKEGLKKGPWTPEEDQKLLAYIEEHGHGNWRALPSRAGLQRCGKSCRLRWTNYLRPDIKRGKFSLQEEQTIIQLHALLGNRWSAIATHLPKRTDNEIKNYWNTHLKKRLTKMGIDPVTHKPKNDALLPPAEAGPHQSKNVANLSHMAQWESARLEAEARLVRQSKLRSYTASNSSLESQVVDLDVLKGWHVTSWPSNDPTIEGMEIIRNGGVIEFLRQNVNNDTNHNDNYNQDGHQGIIKEEMDQHEWNFMSFKEMALSIGGGNKGSGDDKDENRRFIEGFTDLLLGRTTTSTTTTTTTRTSSLSGKSLQEDQGTYNSGSSETTTTSIIVGSDYYEDNKNYWNGILDLVDSSPLNCPMF